MRPKPVKRYEASIWVAKEFLDLTAPVGGTYLGRRLGELVVSVTELLQDNVEKFDGDLHIVVGLWDKDPKDKLQELNCMCSLCGHEHYDAGQDEPETPQSPTTSENEGGEGS